MKVLYLPESRSLKEVVLGIGVFDGLHLAHRRLLSEVSELAKKEGLEAAALTFDPPPPLFFSRKGYLLITTLEEKIELLGKLKMDQIIILKFNREISELPPRKFVEKILLDRARARIVVIGENFSFGRNREGNAQILEELGKEYGFMVVQIPLIRLPSGQVISSSLIRKLIQEGDIDMANRYLCTPLTLVFEKNSETSWYRLRNEEKVQPPPGNYLVGIQQSPRVLKIEYHNPLFLPEVDLPAIRISFLQASP
jgi:FAD synthase